MYVVRITEYASSHTIPYREIARSGGALRDAMAGALGDCEPGALNYFIAGMIEKLNLNVHDIAKHLERS